MSGSISSTWSSKDDDPEIAQPKPAPDIFLLAARRLGIPIEESAIFEDSPAGLEAARASGAHVFPVTEQDAILKLLTAEGIIGTTNEDE